MKRLVVVAAVLTCTAWVAVPASTARTPDLSPPAVPAAAHDAVSTALPPVDPDGREPRYLSLLIGIGEYRYADEGLGLGNLQGPGNDVRRMQHSLERWGFRPDPAVQRVLRDEQASKAGIEAAFRWLIEQATNEDDVVVVYFSGHGSWAPDRDIDDVRRRDEHLITPGDTLDEALVPWDARDAHDPLQLVLDDEIGHWLDQLATVNVTVIIDACYSGTITRGNPDPASASAPRAKGPVQPAFATTGAVAGLMDGQKAMQHTVITAASAWEVAYERAFHPGDVVGGVLTRHLADALDGASPATRFDELMEQVRTRVGQNQTPQLEGDRGARVFRVGEGVVVPERGYANARLLPGERAELQVGAVHGVRHGATYDVYGPGEVNFRDGRLAQVRIDSVFETRSVGAVISGGAFPADARATLSRVPPGAMNLDRLTVHVDPSAGSLRDSLHAFDWIRLSDRPETAMAELRQRDGVYQVLVRGHEVAPLESDETSGHARGRGAVNGFAGTVPALCEPLRRAFAINAMDLVRNDAPPAELQVHLRVLPVSVRDPQRAATSVDTTYVGEFYNVWAWVELPRAAVDHSPFHLTVAVAGYTSDPFVLWPMGRQVNTRLLPEQVNTPLLVMGNVPMSPVTGIENLHIVVNSDPFDLRPLVNTLPVCPPVRAAGTRGNWASAPLIVTGWTAGERRVEIHPARR